MFCYLNSYYHKSTAPSSFKRYIPRLPFDTKRIRDGIGRDPPAAADAREHLAARRPARRLREGRHADLALARGRDRARGEPRGHQAAGSPAPPGDLRRRDRKAERRRRQRGPQDRRRDAVAPGLSLRHGRPVARPGRGLSGHRARADGGGDLHLHRAGLAVRQLPAAVRDHGLAAALADRRDARAAHHAFDAEPVLDDRPRDADGPGDEERHPPGRLREPRPQERHDDGRGAAAGRPRADAPDHDDDRGDGVRHAAARAPVEARDCGQASDVDAADRCRAAVHAARRGDPPTPHPRQ